MSAIAPEKVWRSDAVFYFLLAMIGLFYAGMVVGMLVADGGYTNWNNFSDALSNPDIQYSIRLSLISCTLTAVFSLWVAVPIGYLMSRVQPAPNSLAEYLRIAVDAVLDIPIVLPPLVIGISLLILFQTAVGQMLEAGTKRFFDTGITYEIPSVILAQFMVACAFAVRTMRATFDHLNPRQEQVALSLGCTRAQAFWRVVLPDARKGMITAATLAWARALGEFGPILVFAGATRRKTEVLPTSVFLELTVGHLEAAVAVSLLMVGLALVVLILVRTLGSPQSAGETRTA